MNAVSSDEGRSRTQSWFLAFVLGLTVGTIWTSYLLLWAK